MVPKSKNKTAPVRATAQNRLNCGRPAQGLHRESAIDWQDRLNQFLAAQELNQSESRNRILEVILKEPGHFSTQQLVQKVAETYPAIGPATVYRNIPVLVESGILTETLTTGDGQKVFEVSSDGHHDHIVCLDCHQIFEFHNEAIETAQDKVTDRLRFKPVRHRHVIYAHCEFKNHK